MLTSCKKMGHTTHVLVFIKGDVAIVEDPPDSDNEDDLLLKNSRFMHLKKLRFSRHSRFQLVLVSKFLAT